MFIRLSFVTLIFAVAALGTPVRRDAATVESDLQQTQKQAQALDASISEFPSEGATPAQGLAVHQAAMNLDATIKAAKRDATDSAAFTNTQADAINGLVKANVPLIQKSLGDLVAKKASFSALHLVPIAQVDLEDLKSDTDALGNALISKMPADKQSDARQQLNAIDSALSAAIVAYS